MENSAERIATAQSIPLEAPNTFERMLMEIPVFGTAAKNRWAEQREDTAIQRQMLDMKKAGLNPILAYSGGAGAASSAATQAIQSNSSTLGTAASIASNAKTNKTKKEIAKENNELKQTIAQVSTALEMLKLFA